MNYDFFNRRKFLSTIGRSLSGIALSDLLSRESGAFERDVALKQFDLKPKTSRFAPRAKSVIQLFMHGGPSQVDLLDPKPSLDKYDGQKFPGVIDVQQPEQAGGILKSPFKFAKHGQSGIEVSDVMPHVAKHVDDLCVIRSMWTEHINHEPALWMIHTGRTIPGRPSLGSWVVYGLGSESQDLPAYVVLDDPKGLPVDGIRNWSSGWLPPQFQGTRFRATGTPVWNLNPARAVPAPLQKARRELLAKIDQAHRAARPGEAELDARIASYQLAARMQVSATAALDLSQETKPTQAAYGIGNETTESYGRRCLLARRLVERGVRYVQLFIDGQIWDNHTGLESGIRGACARTDQPVAALLADLKQRGMLDDTLVIWGGEFGRLPISQSKNGRDHGRQGFTMWMAGGGVKAGHVHGATDEFGYAAVEERVSVPDLHATLLYLLGIDHKELTFPRNGLEERLTGVYEPRVVSEILA
ncbi:MAG: DUF1501 domain-containing protein [Planctomycetes bacterium]|nr:DUF1501 domain-containing protein [Planctomycetota bacterium]